MENSLLRNESLQSEMLEVEEFFEELGFVYDTLAEKIADLKIRLEDNEIENSIIEPSGFPPRLRREDGSITNW